MDADKCANASKSAQIGRHDAAAKALCYSSTFSDLVARTEPRRKYACHNGTDCSVTPDVSALGAGGVHDTADIAVVAAKTTVAHRIHEKKFGHGSVDKYYRIQQQEAGVQRDLRRQHRKGLLSTAAFNKAVHQSNSRKGGAYHPGYLGPCAYVGDRFHAIMLTPYGGWWEWGHGGEYNEFLERTAHSGDNAPDYNIEVERFDHHARTWASWTHTMFTRQMVACAIANGTYKGLKKQSLKTVRARSYKLDQDAAHGEQVVRPPEPETAAA